MPRQSPKKQWLFTLNNYTDLEFSSLKERLQEASSYSIIGEEIAPQTGTPHLQGYVSLKKKVRFNNVKTIIGDRAWIHPARGSPRQNKEYCSKDSRVWEHGVLPGPCRASNSCDGKMQEFAQEFIKAIEERTLDQLLNDQPYYTLQYSDKWLRSYNNICSVNLSQRPVPFIAWIYGPTGTGKSLLAHNTLPSAYVKDTNTIWWDGYMQEKEVIMDDMGTDHPPIVNLLQWFSPYKCRVQVKGAYTSLAAHIFIITSNFKPQEIIHTQIEPFNRRVKVYSIEHDLQQFNSDYLLYRSNLTPVPDIDCNSVLSQATGSHLWTDIEDTESNSSETTNTYVMAEPIN